MRLSLKCLATALAIVLPVAEATAQFLNVTGRSYGGRVRMGPGLEHRQIGSTGLNTPIILLQRSARMDGYDWFLIQLPNGNQGYQWGGLMCADSEETGVLTLCGSQEDRELSGLDPSPLPTPSDEVFIAYSCNEGIPLHVRLREEGADFVAYASHDSFPEIRMVQTAGGGILKYEEGAYSLIIAGTEALVDFDGIRDGCRQIN